MSKKDLEYELLDSGNGRKLERLGSVCLDRPCQQAVWPPQQDKRVWKQADAVFLRGKETNTWEWKRKSKDHWEIEIAGVRAHLQPTDFGHLGVFPEHNFLWDWLRQILQKASEPVRVLNLFAYSGIATLVAASEGAQVTHVDAASGMVQWARDNAQLNGLDQAPISWIVDDARKYVARELRRGRSYDVIILDPPSFGRGKRGEVFKIEEELQSLLENCYQLLSDKPLGFFLSCHTPGYTPLVLKNVLEAIFKKKGAPLHCGEMAIIGSKETVNLPSGSYVYWEGV